MATVLCNACWKENDAAAATCTSCGRTLVPAVLDQPRFRLTRTGARTLARRLVCVVLLHPFEGVILVLAFKAAEHHLFAGTLVSAALLLLFSGALGGMLLLFVVPFAFIWPLHAYVILLLVHLLAAWQAIRLAGSLWRRAVPSRLRPAVRQAGLSSRARKIARWSGGVTVQVLIGSVIAFFFDCLIMSTLPNVFLYLMMNP